MSQEVLIDVHVIYNDNGEEQLIFLTNKRRFARVFRKQAGMLDVWTGLLEIANQIGKVLPERATELRNEAVDVGQDCPDCGGSGYMVDEEGNEHQCLLCL